MKTVFKKLNRKIVCWPYGKQVYALLEGVFLGLGILKPRFLLALLAMFFYGYILNEVENELE